MGNNGNGKNGNGSVTDTQLKDLLPAYLAGPNRIISPNLDSSNPGVRLVQNDATLIEMLKIVYVKDEEFARNVAEALAEANEFLLDENGKEDKRVLQRIESIKNLLAIFCSINGRFADAYKQAAAGILTNAMSEGRGWVPIMHPMEKRYDDRSKNNLQPGQRKF